MKRFLPCCIFLILIYTQAAWSQRKPLGFFVAVREDSVFLFFNQSPRIGQGFQVERKGPDDADFQRLTESPVNAVMDAGRARQMLGNDYESLAAALKVQSAEQMLVQLKTDPYYGQVATLISRKAARVLGRFFARGGHRTGETYRYRVLRTDRSGKILESAQEDILIRENPPRPVESLACTQERMSVVVDWDYPAWSGDARDLAFQFMLFRSPDGRNFQCVHDRPILRLEGMPYRFTDAGIETGRRYIYRMVAVDAAGLVSPSVEAAVETRDNTPPQKPGGLIAHAAKGADAVTLNWDRNTDPDLAGYHIYRWAADRKDSVRINPLVLPPAERSFTDSAAVLGTVHYYAVTAVDTAGNESAHSERAHALVTDQTPPGPPGFLSARITGPSVVLSWRPSPDPDAAGYQVRRGYDEITAFKLNQDMVKDTVFVDNGGKEHPLIPGEQYYYSVVAVDTMTY
ncbi:hypothetical protein JW906_09475, partial [bacterium]|nr:hypothetical protein [bacterium]